MQSRKRIIATAIAASILGGAGTGPALAQATTQAVQVELSVPTNPRGMIDTAAVLESVQTRVAQGAREIRFSGVAAADLQALALSSSNPAQSVLARLGALLPSDGVERGVTLGGASDSRVCVQRADDGTLRARVENVTGLTPELLTQIREQLAALGFSRIDLRGARRGATTTVSGSTIAMNDSGWSGNHAGTVRGRGPH
jgi:hypothetical protein